MVKQKFHFSAAMILITFLGIFFGYFVDQMFTDHRAPIVSFGSTQALNSPVAPGENLLVRINREKVRNDCPVTSVRSLMDGDGRLFDIPPGISLVGGEEAEPYFDQSYPIPSNIPSGDYELRVHLIYDCGNSGVFHYDQPSTRFRVLPLGP